MVRREKLHALILSRKNIGEADRLLTLFTRRYGLLRAIAPGVRKIPSRRGGHVEPLSHVLAIVSGNPGHLFVPAVETQQTYPQLHQSAESLYHAHELNRLLVRLFAEEQAHPSLFDALAQAWDLLPQLSSAAQRMLRIAISLHALERAGMQPDLSACQVCSRQQPLDAVILNSGEGGWRCLACHTSLQGTRVSLSPRLLKALRFVARYPERALRVRVTNDESQQLAATMHDYCSTVNPERYSSPISSLSRFDYAP